MKVSHESLYSHIWRNKRAGGTLYKYLRQGGKKRNKRSGTKTGRGMIAGRVDITQRPAIVEAKTRIGDWELDSIIGAKHQGAITSMVERKTKLIKLVLHKNPTAYETQRRYYQFLLWYREGHNECFAGGDARTWNFGRKENCCPCWSPLYKTHEAALDCIQKSVAQKRPIFMNS